MQISDIRIDGFGVWHDQVWKDLSGSVNVFCGPNETGKTTLMNFIRSILFGFERRKHPHRYEPLQGGNYGGSLGLQMDDGPIRVERKAGRHVRGTVSIHHATGTGDEQMLQASLGGTTRTLYHNVFAFGLDELEHFRTLEESEVASHISGAGMGLGASRWSRVHKDLEERRNKLFLPRGQNSTLNRIFKDLGSIRNELDRTEHEPEDYLAAQEERVDLEDEIGNLEEEVTSLSSKVAHYENMRKSEPYRKKRDEIKKSLADIETIKSFPEGGIQSLNLLLHQRRQLEEESSRQNVEHEQKRVKRTELASLYTPQELIRRTRGIESLALLMPRLEATEEIVVAAVAKKDAVVNEHSTIASAADAASPPSAVAVAMFVVLLGVVGGTLFLSEQLAASGGIASLMAVIAVWYYRRSISAASMRSDVNACEMRLQEAAEGLLQVEAQRLEVRTTIEGLLGKVDFTPADLTREEQKVQELAATADKIRSLDEALQREDQQRARLLERVNENEKRISSLLEEAESTTESEFFRRAELFKRRQELQSELDRIPSEIVGLTPEMESPDTFKSEDHSLAAKELEKAKSRLADARRDCGRVDERIRILGKSEERSRIRMRQESVLASMEDHSQKWAILTLCRALLEETRKVYETERQPEVLKAATEFFDRMSAGRYVRVINPLGTSELLIERQDGMRLGPEGLSRGTAEQLYLAVRLALVREYSRHVEPLPVIFDDIFVNFDPERTRNSIEAVHNLSETHQILLFTCHPHLSNLVSEIVPSARVFQLQ